MTRTSGSRRISGFLPDGSIVIADGLRKSRVVKLDKNGKFIKAWGTKGNADGQFSGLHGIETDKSGRVYVADRGNHRVQIFDANGAHLDTCRHPVPRIRFWSRPIRNRSGCSTATRTGFSSSIRTASCRTWWGVFGYRPGEFWEMHQLSVDSEGSLYIADSFGGRATKLKPRADGDKTKLVSAPLPLMAKSAR